MARYQAVRGTFDVLPQQIPAWCHLEKTARNIANRFGFREIRTPLFEQAELYTKGMGVMAGLIEKELWTFQDKFGQKLALRADITAGTVRAFQQHKMADRQLPQKLFYLGPVFLLGKEGEQGSRQGHQFGFEALGSDSPALDAEVIALASTFCKEIGLEDHTILLNSVGCDESRPLYQQKLRDYFNANSEQLCSTCKRKYKTHPEWVLSCEEEGCCALAQVAPTIFALLPAETRSHFNRLREYLQAMDLPVELDPRVVRDSEYYKRTVFELKCGKVSLGFGGRYDNLAERLGGKATPGVGFALSLETILDLLGEQDFPSEQSPSTIFFRPEGPESAKLLVPLLHEVRSQDIAAELDYNAEFGKAQAPPEGCLYLISLDESNAFRGSAVITTLSDNKEERVPISRLAQKVQQLVGGHPKEQERVTPAGRKKLKRGRKRSDELVDSSAVAPEERDEQQVEAERDDQESKSRQQKGRRDSRRTPETRKPAREIPEPKEKAAEKPVPSRERKGRPRPEPSETSDDGKAIVPALFLGAVPAATAKPQPNPKEKNPGPGKAAKETPSKPAPTSTDLNWSILPGQESPVSKAGNGSSKSTKSPKKKESKS